MGTQAVPFSTAEYTSRFHILLSRVWRGGISAYMFPLKFVMDFISFQTKLFTIVCKMFIFIYM